MFQNHLRRLTLAITFALLLFVPETAAQQTTNVEDRRNEFGVWGGYSFDTSTLIGKTPNARFGHIGLRYGRILAANQDLAFSWTIDAVPVAVLSVKR